MKKRISESRDLRHYKGVLTHTRNIGGISGNKIILSTLHIDTDFMLLGNILGRTSIGKITYNKGVELTLECVIKPEGLSNNYHTSFNRSQKKKRIILYLNGYT